MPRRAATEEVLGAADPVIKERHEMTLMLLRGDWFNKHGACPHWRICRWKMTNRPAFIVNPITLPAPLRRAGRFGRKLERYLAANTFERYVIWRKTKAHVFNNSGNAKVGMQLVRVPSLSSSWHAMSYVPGSRAMLAAKVHKAEALPAAGGLTELRVYTADHKVLSLLTPDEALATKWAKVCLAHGEPFISFGALLPAFTL
jgi:hypothetical protein